MIWPITAPDLLRDLDRACEVAGLQVRRHRIPQRLVLRRRDRQEYPPFDGDGRAESEDDDDRNHEDPAVLEEPDDDVIDLHLSLLFARPV